MEADGIRSIERFLGEDNLIKQEARREAALLELHAHLAETYDLLVLNCEVEEDITDGGIGEPNQKWAKYKPTGVPLTLNGKKTDMSITVEKEVYESYKDETAVLEGCVWERYDVKVLAPAGNEIHTLFEVAVNNGKVYEDLFAHNVVECRTILDRIKADLNFTD